MAATSKQPKMNERYQASMILSGVGDALGFNQGAWEFEHNGRKIYNQLMAMTNNQGLPALKLDAHWIVSDDTVLHIATADALVSFKKGVTPPLFPLIAKHYKIGMKDMSGRAPGGATVTSMNAITPDGSGWNKIPYSPSAGGCGAAMRAMCIGLAFHAPEQLERLIEVAVESGRMTHHNGTGFLGSVAAAVFTAYCVQEVPLHLWGTKLLNEVIPKTKDYLTRANRAAKECIQGMNYFIDKWTDFLKLRQIDAGGEAVFPQQYDYEDRDRFYNSVSFSGWGGSSGHDAPMIAYDAILFAKSDWNTLMYHAAIHGGDSDSTGVMAGAWFGALFGFEGVPEGHYATLEYGDRLKKLGDELYLKFYENYDPEASDNAANVTGCSL